MYLLSVAGGLLLRDWLAYSHASSCLPSFSASPPSLLPSAHVALHSLQNLDHRDAERVAETLGAGGLLLCNWLAYSHASSCLPSFPASPSSHFFLVPASLLESRNLHHRHGERVAETLGAGGLLLRDWLAYSHASSCLPSFPASPPSHFFLVPASLLESRNLHHRHGERGRELSGSWRFTAA
jgi:hypothetical protein